MASKKTTVKTLAMPQEGAESLIALAIQKGVDVDALERLLGMRRELEAERAKKAFDSAMASFQADCPTIHKTKQVKDAHGRVLYSYAPIEAIVTQVKDALKQNGFSYTTNMKLLAEGVTVSVKVTHLEGHAETTEMTVPLGQQTGIMSRSQVVASAQTFAKRYAFCNAFGILTGDEDTDGAETTTTTTTDDASQKVLAAKITASQKVTIMSLLGKKGKGLNALTATIGLLTQNRTEAVGDLSYEEAQDIIRKLSNLPDKVAVYEAGEQINLDDIPDDLGEENE